MLFGWNEQLAWHSTSQLIISSGPSTSIGTGISKLGWTWVLGGVALTHAPGFWLFSFPADFLMQLLNKTSKLLSCFLGCFARGPNEQAWGAPFLFLPFCASGSASVVGRWQCTDGLTAHSIVIFLAAKRRGLVRGVAENVRAERTGKFRASQRASNICSFFFVAWIICSWSILSSFISLFFIGCNSADSWTPLFFGIRTRTLQYEQEVG